MVQDSVCYLSIREQSASRRRQPAEKCSGRAGALVCPLMGPRCAAAEARDAEQGFGRPPWAAGAQLQSSSARGGAPPSASVPAPATPATPVSIPSTPSRIPSLGAAAAAATAGSRQRATVSTPSTVQVWHGPRLPPPQLSSGILFFGFVCGSDQQVYEGYSGCRSKQLLVLTLHCADADDRPAELKLLGYQRHIVCLACSRPVPTSCCASTGSR